MNNIKAVTNKDWIIQKEETKISNILGGSDFPSVMDASKLLNNQQSVKYILLIKIESSSKGGKV